MSTIKIAGNLQAQMQAMALDEPMGVIVRHKREAFSAQRVVTDAQVTHSYRLIPATAMRVRPSGIEALSRDQTVEYIWPDLPVHTCLDVSTPRIQAPSVWKAGLRGEGIKIGIVDTGIDPHHTDFEGRLMAMTNLVATTQGLAGGDATDDNGHGTHVASIAAGTGAASGGKYQGVAPAASLYVAKVLDANGGGTMSGVMAGVEWAVDQGVHVINLSLGSTGPCDGTDALSTLCDQAVQQHGTVICVAAGNAGPSDSTVGSPGCARWVITIGAVDDADKVTDFSSRGPTSDGRVKPDLVFPGAGIVAAQANGTALGSVVAPGYVELSGTSMATPHATGSVALLLQAQPGLTPNQIRWTLLTTALGLGESLNVQGSGRGNVYAAYQKILSETPPDGTEPPEPGSPGTQPQPRDGCLPQIRRLFRSQ
ncbi:MAG: S8 family serine peptidase [Anaerolineales bacterium]|nr:MAG: S8 family serine peptidase [Anaerolineales bacterium]